MKDAQKCLTKTAPKRVSTTKYLSTLFRKCLFPTSETNLFHPNRGATEKAVAENQTTERPADTWNENDTCWSYFLFCSGKPRIKCIYALSGEMKKLLRSAVAPNAEKWLKSLLDETERVRGEKLEASLRGSLKVKNTGRLSWWRENIDGAGSIHSP